MCTDTGEGGEEEGPHFELLELEYSFRQPRASRLKLFVSHIPFFLVTLRKHACEAFVDSSARWWEIHFFKGPREKPNFAPLSNITLLSNKV